MTSKEHPTATITTPNSTPGQSGRFGSEWVAAFRRNQWPLSSECAHDIASELVRGLTHPQLDLLGRLGARLGTKLLATQCEHPGGRLDDPRRQAGKIDGRRRRRRGYCHGNAPDVGFQDTASYRFWRCGAFPPSPARPCRRDKILPWSGPLSRIAVFGRPSRHQNRTKSMTWIFHTRPTPWRALISGSSQCSGVTRVVGGIASITYRALAMGIVQVPSETRCASPLTPESVSRSRPTPYA